MQRRSKKAMISALLACGILAGGLCGCTRREQLILDTGTGVVRAEEEAPPEQGGPQERESTGFAAREPERTAVGQTEAEASGGAAQETAAAQTDEERTVCVHVCGAVNHAGVYELPTGSRVFEAIEMAGGFTEDADESYVNQAQQLADGSKLVIPTVEQARMEAEQARMEAEQDGTREQTAASSAEGYGVTGGQETAPDAASSADGKININTATREQLCGIPGIGETRAAAIVAYRQESGGFKAIEDIMKVSGIKEGTYAKIKDRITVK